MKQVYTIMTIILCTTSFCLSSNTASAQDKTYSIGERGPAGGWIFYDKGSKTDGWQYLEAAPEDIGDEIGWYAKKYIDMKPTFASIGSGKANTNLIIKTYGDGKYAARICVDYTNGGKNDWFLPSREERDLMFTVLMDKGISNFKGSKQHYWSSTEDMDRVALLKSFYAGNRCYSFDVELPKKRVRAIRAF
jgi:hypothetical protein